VTILSDLWLHEELVLLAIQPHKGTIPLGTPLQHPMAGAGLSEMLLAGRIRLDKVKRSQRVIIVQTSLLGEPLLDEWFERIRTARKPASPETWVAQLASARRMTRRMIERLWFQGIVRREERSVLWLFTRYVHPVINVQARDAVIERMRICLNGACEPPARDAFLLGLAKHANLLRTIFSALELKRQRQRIKSLIKSHPILAAVGNAAASRHEGAAIIGTLTPLLSVLALA
jgi:hypothetical protein